MTDREKLIKLLCEANSMSVDAELFEDSSYAQQLEIEADFLIANGVTVQGWIPVTQRLPERPGNYIVCTEKGSVTTCHWYEANSKTGLSAFFSPRSCVVTHWMPLPEPPKE